MPQTDYDEVADELEETLEEHDVEPDREDILDRLRMLVGQYAVPMDEARRSVLTHYAEETDTDIEGASGSGGGSVTDVDIGSIDKPDNWVNIEGTVTTIWDDNPDSIRQAGLIGDTTGRIKFTSWEDADLPLLQEDKSYRLENVVTDEYEGRMSVNMTSNAEVTELDETIEASDSTEVVSGALIDFQSGSGLIKRCPEEDCSFVVQNSTCQEHGTVDGEFDLRIKGVIDNGNEVQEVIFDREMTELIGDLTLEDAKESAKQALDTTVVDRDLREKLLGRYYKVEGPVAGRYLLVQEFEEVTESERDPTELMSRIKGM